MPTPKWRKRKAPKVGPPAAAGGPRLHAFAYASIHHLVIQSVTICICLRIHSPSGHSVSDHLWGSIGENRYKELVSQATFFEFLKLC